MNIYKMENILRIVDENRKQHLDSLSLLNRNKNSRAANYNRNSNNHL